MSEREPLEQAYRLAEGYLATGQYEAASRVVATLLNYDSNPNYHHLRLLLEEIVAAEPIASAQVSLATILLGGDTGEQEPERAVGLLRDVVDRIDEVDRPGPVDLGEVPDGGTASASVIGLAHELLADCHISGTGVAADPGAAFHHFCRAADLGRSKAAYNVGLAYHQGLLDQPVDLDQARHFFLLAAEAGEARALTRLALIEIEEADADAAAPDQAIELLERARSLGDSDAQEILDRIDDTWSQEEG